MNKRWFNNFCAVCVVILVCAAIFVLGGCASVEMTKKGEDITWSSKTLWKDIEKVEAGNKGKDFSFGLGSSSSALSSEQMDALACLRDPTVCR